MTERSPPPEQAVKLRQCLVRIDELEAHRKESGSDNLQIAEPFSAVLDLLYTLPGLDKNPMTAIAILSEIGLEMSVFPSSKHLVSWTGCCPRNNQSNQKVKSRRISRTDSYLKPLLVQVANALIKSKKHPEFEERYHRLLNFSGFGDIQSLISSHCYLSSTIFCSCSHPLIANFLVACLLYTFLVVYLYFLVSNLHSPLSYFLQTKSY